MNKTNSIKKSPGKYFNTIARNLKKKSINQLSSDYCTVEGIKGILDQAWTI